ncbi:DUF2076 domain-containing protein [Dongshaea marina]|uniref:DUF2076 domain-containing protein n=1 Tax=Dongshaea marina TaxID=2047966 RepID=UPI00131F2A79|nr:DUF2076 family protein [Dongshaea marina]
MQAHEKQLIVDLAKRLESSSDQAIDPRAEELISKEIAGQPHAVYLLTQAVLLQEQALREQKQQLEELRGQQPEDPGRTSFLGGYLAKREGHLRGLSRCRGVDTQRQE